MSTKQERKLDGAPERAGTARADTPSGADAGMRQWHTGQRKMSAMLRMLHWEQRETMEREMSVTTAHLSE